jgi:hypothetical protein
MLTAGREVERGKHYNPTSLTNGAPDRQLRDSPIVGGRQTHHPTRHSAFSLSKTRSRLSALAASAKGHVRLVAIPAGVPWAPAPYPYMKPADKLLISLGVLVIMIGLLVDNFGPVPRWLARICFVLLGILAISTVLWRRIYG